RIKELGSQLNSNGGAAASRGVSAITALKEPIKQVAIGPSHIAVLTESGTVGRFVFSINTDALDLNKPDPNKGRRSSNKGSGGGGGSAKLSSRMSGGGSGRRLVRTPSSGGSALRAGSGSVLLGSSGGGGAAVLPVQYVPEDLVSQAQVVLQGKSRSLIIRELQ
ncbi:E3 ubiquitin ligase EDD ubiquitin-associated domain, partial [Trinorchestia longiramus]